MPAHVPIPTAAFAQRPLAYAAQKDQILVVSSEESSADIILKKQLRQIVHL